MQVPLSILNGSDALRRSLGGLLDAAGLAPRETVWVSVVKQPGITLRYYPGGGHCGPVLIVPAPIKRPYIFDLMPQVSVVVRLIEAGFSVFLMDWAEDGGPGVPNLSKYSEMICSAAGKVRREARRKPIVLGHSLGGTLAAISAALEPDSVSKLVLISAPLRFGEETGALAPIVTWRAHRSRTK